MIHSLLPQKHHKRNHRKPKDENGDPNRQDNSSEEVEEQEDVLYSVANSDIFGRYLVAKRTIKPGEVIIFEHPVVIGPSCDTDCSCLGCYIPLSPAEENFK